MNRLSLHSPYGIIGVPENTSIPLEINSRFFDLDALRNSYAYNFQILLPKNFNHNISNSELSNSELENGIIENVSLLSDGELVNTGNLFINKSTTNINSQFTTYQAQLSFEDKNFIEYAEKTKLNDLKLCGIINIPGDEINDPIFPIPTLPNTTIHQTRDWVNANFNHPWFAFPYIKINNEKNGLASEEFVNFNFIYSGSTFYPTYNFYSNGTFDILNNAICPMFYYWRVLDSIFSEFGYYLDCDLFNSSAFRKLVFINFNSILKSQFIAVLGFSSVGFQHHRENATEINPKNHLPDCTIGEFLRSFMLQFGCSFEFNGKNVKVKFIKKSKVKDITKFIGPEYSTENAEATGIEFKYNYDENDNYLSIYRNTVSVFNEIPNVIYPNPSNTIFSDENYFNYNNFLHSNLFAYQSGKTKEFSSDFAPLRCNELKLIESQSVTHDISGNILPNAFPRLTYTDKSPNIIPARITKYYQPFSDIVLDEDNIQTVTYSHETKFIGFYMADINGGYIKSGATYASINYNGLYNEHVNPLNEASFDNFHLGWLGKYSLLSVFYGDFLKALNKNKVVYFQANFRTIAELLNNTEPIIYVRGKLYYVAQISNDLPISNPFILKCYEF